MQPDGCLLALAGRDEDDKSGRHEEEGEVKGWLHVLLAGEMKAWLHGLLAQLHRRSESTLLETGHGQPVCH